MKAHRYCLLAAIFAASLIRSHSCFGQIGVTIYDGYPTLDVGESCTDPAPPNATAGQSPVLQGTAGPFDENLAASDTEGTSYASTSATASLTISVTTFTSDFSTSGTAYGNQSNAQSEYNYSGQFQIGQACQFNLQVNNAATAGTYLFYIQPEFGYGANLTNGNYLPDGPGGPKTSSSDRRIKTPTGVGHRFPTAGRSVARCCRAHTPCILLKNTA